MKIVLHSLTLNCKNGVEAVGFGRQLSFFHGEMSAGKSSIASLVDHCLGGRLERTPALSSELISVQLNATIGDSNALIERVMTDSGNVQVSWVSPDGAAHSESVPVKAAPAPVVGTEIHSLSDLLLHLLGFPVLRVRKRSFDPESELVRLSFRDISEFVYLDQSHLDSDFFLLDVPIRMEKSKDALRFMVGFMSERLSELQDELQGARGRQRSMREAAAQIQEFLSRFEFESEARLNEEIAKCEAEVERIEAELARLKEGAQPGMSIGEEDKAEIAKLDETIKRIAESTQDVRDRIEEQDRLMAELVGMKFKVSRAATATVVLDGVEFERCPACGASLPTVTSAGACHLCKSAPDARASPTQVEVYQHDLDERIDDLKESIQRHRRALQRNESNLQETRRKRSVMDRLISEKNRAYESDFLARSRNSERRMARLQERVDFLERVKQMPASVERIQKDADELSATIERLKRELAEEESKLIGAERNFKRIEDNYKEILLAIGFPGVSDSDLIIINRRSLIPEIWPHGDEAKSWTFFDAGSGGKKTLLNISFAWAVHKAAADNGLPIPHLLIIDSPMKNITPDVNRDIFRKFYEELYSLLDGPLADWQLVLVDQTYFPPSNTKLQAVNRKLTLSDPENPPLIRYYVGP